MQKYCSSVFRQAYIRKLMEKIRFPLMPPRDLMVHVNVVDFMRTKCNDLLLEVSFIIDVFSEPL